MKRIALTLAALVLGAGAAFAASPAAPAAPPAKRIAVALRNDHPARRITEALNLLEAKGYGAFSNFKADGSDFAATVNKGGKDVMVQIDPDSGQITTQS